jgi:hypothetical protein
MQSRGDDGAQRSTEDDRSGSLEHSRFELGQRELGKHPPELKANGDLVHPSATSEKGQQRRFGASPVCPFFIRSWTSDMAFAAAEKCQKRT